ncbi:MAG: protein kinase, partial [Verrucomicrobiota bacterium]
MNQNAHIPDDDDEGDEDNQSISDSSNEEVSNDGDGEEQSENGETQGFSDLNPEDLGLDAEAFWRALETASTLNQLDSFFLGQISGDGVSPLDDVSAPEELPPVPFPDRFQIVDLPGRKTKGGVLGKGATSCVYSVYDNDRKEYVALKVLRLDRARRLFKQEFSKMHGIVHTNLVTPFAHVIDGDREGMTMRLIDGVPVSSWVYIESGDGRSGRFDGARIRSALTQIFAGLTELHRNGHVHQDLKPGNILVDRDGHLFILDFGLVTWAAGFRNAMPDHKWSEAGGTWVYMAPAQHQFQSGDPDPRSDWYSVGVILYRLLTGKEPFQELDDKDELLRLKMEEQYPPLPEFEDPWLTDAADLCERLLKSSPEARATDRDVRDFLAISDDEVAILPNRSSEMVGRNEPLRQLGKALELSAGISDENEAAAPKLVVCPVKGKSGLGKSMLVRSFVDQIHPDLRPLVLAGKCEQQRSTEFNAVEPLMDQLAGYLSQLESWERERYRLSSLESSVPLMKMFRDLALVPEIRAADQDETAQSLQDLRSSALQAIPKLLERIAEHHTLILIIDDLQWADEESLEALRMLLKTPIGKGILLITTIRSEAAKYKVVAGFDKLLGEFQDNVQVFPVELHQFSRTESDELVRRLAGHHDIDLDWIFGASRGDPQLIEELVFEARREGGSRSKDVLEIYGRRFQRLHSPKNELMAVLAVAGQPVPRTVAFRAAGIVTGDKTQTELELMRDRFAKSHGSQQRDLLDVCHDRVREGILAHLADDQKVEYHWSLATAFEKHLDLASAYVLAVHFELGEGLEKAGMYYEKAGDEAMEQFAFASAFEHFEKSQLLRPTLDNSDVIRLLEKQGEAKAHSGKGLESGLKYREAADYATGKERDRLQHLATEQFLISGNLDEAIKGLKKMLEAAGLRDLPPWLAASKTILRRYLKLKGHSLEFEPRAESDLTYQEAMERESLDLCWTLVLGYGFREVMLAGEFQNVGLFRSLKLGCPKPVIRSLCMEAWYQSAFGRSNASEVERFLKKAADLNEELKCDYSRGMISLAGGASDWLLGHFKSSVEKNEEAERIFTKEVTGHFWEPDTGLIYKLFALVNVGEFARVGEICDTKIPEARIRGDFYLETNLRCYPKPWALIAADQPEEAGAMAKKYIGLWNRNQNFSEKHQQAQHILAWVTQIEAALYRRDADLALELVEAGWTPFEKSKINMVQHCRVQALYCRGRAHALKALLSNDIDRDQHLRQASRDAKRLVKREVGRNWAVGLGHLILASVAAQNAGQEDVVQHLELAAEKLRKGEAFTKAAAANYVRAKLEGDDELLDEAKNFMRENGVSNPK